MTPAEQGFLLLTSHLGDLTRKVLTVAQFRVLAQAVRSSQMPDGNGELTEKELMAMGFNRPSAQRILSLLSEQERLLLYLKDGERWDCVPVSRVSKDYPLVLRKRLGLDSPGCLWLKGDMSVIDRPKIALVGSRELNERNRAFAEEAGRQAAKQGFTLVSGNARGADTVAQDACLAAGGSVISVVADSLCEHARRKGVLYVSEDGYDLPFTSQRALSRNRLIHALGNITVVAQCHFGSGGTWDGTRRNLRNIWSPVFCLNDGTAVAKELVQMGATGIGIEELQDYAALIGCSGNLFDQ